MATSLSRGASNQPTFVASRSQSIPALSRNPSTRMRYRAAILPIQPPTVSSGNGRGASGHGLSEGSTLDDMVEVHKADAFGPIHDCKLRCGVQRP